MLFCVSYGFQHPSKRYYIFLPASTYFRFGPSLNISTPTNITPSNNKTTNSKFRFHCKIMLSSRWNLFTQNTWKPRKEVWRSHDRALEFSSWVVHHQFFRYISGFCILFYFTVVCIRSLLSRTSHHYHFLPLHRRSRLESIKIHTYTLLLKNLYIENPRPFLLISPSPLTFTFTKFPHK